MNVITTGFEGLVIIEPRVHEDSRGYFFESFNLESFLEAGINFSPVQDNESRSSRGVIRGLHYQTGDKAQGKLCQVITGRVLDIAVDIRFGSSSFGKYIALELSGENHKQLWIPPGFAHGFSVLSDYAVFLYKCTNFYSKEHERTIIYNDPKLKIDWGIENPVISEKDLNGKSFDEIERDFVYSEMKI